MSAVRTFPSGVHPHDEKSWTAGKAVQTILPKAGSEMVFPMSQHIGAPCEPLVAVGDKVLLGQKIGDSEKFVTSPVHSSVSGAVTAIRKAETPSGTSCQAVVIENDGQDQGVKPKDDKLQSLPDKAEILRRIREAGVVGLGGAGFPTHIKLSPPPEKKIDTLIVNAAECEPYLTTDHRVMLEMPDRMISGFKIILSLFPGAKGYIAIEINKPEAIEKITKLVEKESNIEVVSLKTKYPQGAEKQLIYACTHREVPSGGLPADIGCLVDNVDTVVAIQRAVLKERPLIRRIITVSGGAAANPGNYKVRIGMKYSDMMEAIGGFKSDPYKLISGGPMMGVALFTLDIPVIKTSSSLLCFTEEEGKLPEERNCIRCGKCVDHCPMRLMPLDLNQYVIHNEMDSFVANHGLDCIECGTCSYVCPAKRYLAQSIRTARKEMLARRK
ncbi:MAG: electron transport complex subunit RsxC [Peptococcaceae bacterium]|jgi:electron transport complex protein RnfC|nr:electron transport complex subunit RsxC [Peptococcaceae bacterium]